MKGAKVYVVYALYVVYDLYAGGVVLRLYVIYEKCVRKGEFLLEVWKGREGSEIVERYKVFFIFFFLLFFLTCSFSQSTSPHTLRTFIAQSTPHTLRATHIKLRTIDPSYVSYHTYLAYTTYKRSTVFEGVCYKSLLTSPKPFSPPPTPDFFSCWLVRAQKKSQPATRASQLFLIAEGLWGQARDLPLSHSYSAFAPSAFSFSLLLSSPFSRGLVNIKANSPPVMRRAAVFKKSAITGFLVSLAGKLASALLSFCQPR